MAVTALTAFLPSIVSKSIFAPRRADKSIESDNAAAGALNAGIAVMQLSKLGDGVAAIRKENNAAKTVSSASKNIASKGSIFNDISKATNQITKHVSINGFIGLAALTNALASDDKETALIQNGGMYGGMLAFEGAHKAICGTVDINGDKIDKKEGLYRDYEFLRKPIDNFKTACERKAETMEAVKDCGEVKRALAKVVKCTPAVAKGLSFAAMSIGGSALGYNLFGKVAETVTDRQVA